MMRTLLRFLAPPKAPNLPGMDLTLTVPATLSIQCPDCGTPARIVTLHFGTDRQTVNPCGHRVDLWPTLVERLEGKP